MVPGPRPSRIRLTLGHWLILVAYAAAILTPVALAIRIEDPGRSVAWWMMISIVLPYVAAAFPTRALARPTARRDLSLLLFLALPSLAFSCWIGLVLWRYRHDLSALVSLVTPGIRGEGSRKAIVGLLATIGLFWLAIPALIGSGFRGRCPACRRPLLVRPYQVAGTGRARSLLDDFAWCASCGSRWKRRRRRGGRGAWADASDPADDRWFGLTPETHLFPWLTARPAGRIPPGSGEDAIDRPGRPA